MISPTPTHPHTAGNRARISVLMTMLRDMGHDVHFLHVRRERGDDAMMRHAWGEGYISTPYKKPSSRLQKYKRRLCGYYNTDARYTYGIDEWYDPALDETLRTLDQRLKFDTVIVEYVFFSKALKYFGKDVLKIIDTHDAFTNRHRHYLERGEQPRWFSTTAGEEGRGFDRADVIIAITDKEKDAFSKITKRPVITVGHMVPLHKPDKSADAAGKILFVASNNDINVHGVEHFLDSIFPKVRQSVPGAELVLVGSVCDAILDQDGLIKLGRVEDLKEVYDSALLVINPVLINTGLSIKNIEALGYSKPLVTLRAGIGGFNDSSETAFLVAENTDDFVNKIINVLTNAEISRNLSKNAYEYASQWNRKVSVQLEQVLN